MSHLDIHNHKQLVYYLLFCDFFHQLAVLFSSCHKELEMRKKLGYSIINSITLSYL